MIPANAGMTCTETRDRLVAFQDDELSRSEAALVERHLEHCSACMNFLERLDAASPAPALVIPAAMRQELHQRLADAIEQGEEAGFAPPSSGSVARIRHWLTRETEVPVGALLAYAAMLLLAVGWGATNWWSAASLRAQLDPTEIADHTETPPPAGVEIPAEQYKPASYQPEDAVH